MICFGGFLFPVIFGNKHGRMRILARNPERMAKPVGCLNSARTGKGTRMPKVSVVVPCYNVEKYVARCLDSLISQTVQDIEIICIDDKSTDGTLDIVKQYAARDGRVRLIAHDVNMGVAVARNDGMNIARGEYIGFVDPDDYVDLDFYERLYTAGIASCSDVVKGNVCATDNLGRVTYGDAQQDAISHNAVVFSNSFWSAIYSKDFLEQNKITFPANIRTSQDSVFLTMVCLAVKQIYLVYNTYYHYFYQRPGSLDSQHLTHYKAESKLNAFSINMNLIENALLTSKDFEQYVDIHVLSHVVYEIQKDFEADIDRKKFFDFVADIHHKYGLRKQILIKFGRDGYRCIHNNDYDNFTVAHKTRLYLFGFLPVVLIKKLKNYTDVKLFDFIPLARLTKTKKLFLFNYVLILKIKG